MADLARAARPWLSSLQPIKRSSPAPLRLGLGLGFSRNLSATAACHAAAQGRYPRSANKSTQRRGKVMEIESVGSFLLPYTVVPPPISRFPRSPRKFAEMVWMLGKNRVQALASLMGVTFMSMQHKVFSWPRFRARRRAAIPAAKALHAQMSEAVAAGDRDTLRRICTAELFQTLAGAIDARPAGVRAEWELVRYADRLRYPRLADFRVTYQPVGGGGKALRLVKQAVVSISSVQRIARYDDRDGGRKVPGTERERHMVEHLVLQAGINESTYEAETWKVWGTLPEMPYETICEDTVMYEEAVANNARRKAGA
ncbi:hypothetical protein F4802DRAFT_599392 [Xylaria palmicola]|nr:hypothetical protein F4802DRAFT_599392 [Xylaria palmicola]